MGKVLVLDGHLRSSLAVVRSLGKRGVEVTVGSENRLGLALYSKYASSMVLYPSPRLATDRFLAWLRTLVKTIPYDCVLPSHTDTMYILAKHREQLEAFTSIPPPPFDVFVAAYDKQRLFEVAKKYRIPIPTTYDARPSLPGQIERYPVVVKASRRHSMGIAVCRNAKELVNAYPKLSKRYGPCVVQEYVPNGGEFGVYTLLDEHSVPLSLVVQQRIRTLHGYGGLSTLRRTIESDELVRIAFRLLKHLHWSGVAMVEFRVDTATGQPKVLEVNPRLWGSLQLAVEAGVDFPSLLYDFTLGQAAVPDLRYRTGVECRWFLGDVLGFLRCGRKMRELRSFLNPKIPLDIFSWHDIKPALFSVYLLSNSYERRHDTDSWGESP